MIELHISHADQPCLEEGDDEDGRPHQPRMTAGGVELEQIGRAARRPSKRMRFGMSVGDDGQGRALPPSVRDVGAVIAGTLS